MLEEILVIVDNLSEVIQNMQKSLQCIICLHTLSNPVRTQCGHRFCRECIQMVLQNRNATCPLCNSVIHRRNIREDQHIEMYNDRLKKLIEAIQMDTGIDISMYVSRPRSTRESCSSDNTDTLKLEQEDHNQPSCSYAQPKPVKPASSKTNRALPKSRRSKNSKTRKDSISETLTIRKYFSKYAVSGVEPLPSDDMNYSDENSKEINVQSWLESLPENMDFYNPDRMRTPKSNLDDTLVYSMSQKKVLTDDREPERPGTLKDNSSPRDLSSKGQKNEDARESMIKVRESRRCSSTSTPSINEVSGRMQTDRVDKRRSSSSTGEDVVQEHGGNRPPRHINKTSPCDLLPSTKKNWSSVVQFGKEMRSKKKKIRSLNVSIENKNKKSTDEFVKEPVPKPKELPRSSTRRSTLELSNDANEKLPVHKDSREQQTGDKNNGSMLEEARPAGESSFIMLEQGEQVHISNLNSYQMNNIIGVDGDRREVDIENRPHNDGDSERRFLQELGLCWTPTKTEIKSSSMDVTSVEQPRENLSSPNLLDGYVSPSMEESTIPMSEPRPEANLPSSTPLPNRLSLKRRDTGSKLDDPVTDMASSRLLAVKRDLDREIARDAAERIMVTESTETPRKPDENNRRDNRQVGDAETANKQNSKKPENKRQEKSLVMFKKLGKVVKYRRRPVRFLYLGSTIRRSSGIQDRIERLQRLCNPAQQESPRKLASENSFCNNTTVTANNDVSQDDGNLEVGKEVAAVTAQEAPEKNLSVGKVSEISREPSTNTVASFHIPVAPKLNIESCDTLSKDIVTAPVASGLLDSNDILFVSIYESQQNSAQPVHQRLPPKNTTLEKSIKLLSPRNDSQLKFLSLDSPTAGTQSATKQQDDKNITSNRSNLSDTRGLHARAPVRVLRQSFEELEVDTASRKKRKRSSSRDNQVEKMKRTTDDNKQEEAEENSCHSFSIKGATSSKDTRTDRKDNVKTYCPAGQSTRDIEIVSLSSDSDAENREGASKEQKGVYKRVVPLDTSMSSSSKKNTTAFSCNEQTTPASKRKRSISPDSNDVDKIVSSWSKDLKPTDRFSRKTNAEECVPGVSTNVSSKRGAATVKSSSSDSSVIPRRTAPFKRRCLFSSDPESKLDKLNVALPRSSNEESVDDNDSPDFGATIDRIRDIQRTATTTFNDPARERGKEVVCLMQDNFDEIIANVDTEQLIGDYCGGPKRRSVSGDVGVERPRDPNKQSMGTRLQKGSDTEKEYKESGRLYDSESEVDKTLTPEQVNATDNRSAIADDGSRGRVKPVVPTIRNNVAKRLSTITTVLHDSDKMIEGRVSDVTLKDTCFDQDSLMNITQHQMMIKQFEDDLFGRTSNPAVKYGNEQRTPQKTKKEGDRCSDLKEQDAEHSGEEDDIVENTPTIKAKNMPSLNSSGKKSSTEASMVRMNMDRAGSTPSSTSGRSTSSLYQRSKKPPLYQSTPKVQAKEQAKGDCMGVANTSEKAASTNQPMYRPVNEVAVINGQSLARQRLCFVCSGLVPAEVEQVRRLANLVNAGYVNQFDLSVTHVIVKADEENGANKTLKYLQGIAHRKWIVSYQWVIDSLREEKLVNEERYEVVDCRTLEAGPRNSRLRQKDLFDGFAFLCIGPYLNVSVNQYEELLRATGGTVVNSLEALTAEQTRMKIVVIQEDMHEFEIIGWYRDARAVPVVHDWIVECISQYKLISFYPYLQELLRQDVLALGYPNFLVEDDPDDEDDGSVCDTTPH